MSRRSGQNGRIERKGNVLYARFWLDVAGSPKRVYKSVRICPISGPGSLNKFEQKRRLKEIIAESGANSVEIAQQAEAVNLGTTFKEQSERWFKEVQERKRKPIKPRTADAWSTYLSYINTKIGQVPLSQINNLTVKDFVCEMAAEQKNGKPRFSPKSIDNYVQVIKMVVGSVKNEKAERVYPVEWDNNFMDLPVIKDQRRPSFMADQIDTILGKAKGKYAALYALLGGSGLRIEECLALQVEDIRDTVIRVRYSLWRGKLYSPKTDAGIREVDICPALADLLRNHIGDRTSGFVFQTSAGKPLGRSNVLRRSLHKILEKMGHEKCGFHAFRRYRVTYLRKSGVREDLIRFWIGHADGDVTDTYSKIKEDVGFRQRVSEQIGTGFNVPISAVELPVARIAPILYEVQYAANA